MLMGNHLATKNKINKIIILLSYLIIFLLFFVFKVKWDCPFKKFLHIACPGCGLTRAIRNLLSFKIIESIRINILGIPIVILVLLSIILIIKDLIKKENKFIENTNKIIKKYYIFIIIILVIVAIINNINNI